MRTIEEIRQRKIEGKKKWGKDLLEFITPYVDDGRTYEEIAIILANDYDIQINPLSLANLKSKYKYKLPKSKEVITAEITPNYKKENFKTEQIKEEHKIAQNQDGNIDISKYDFRTPSPKPSYENWKK